MNRIISLDVEATGVDPVKDRIVQIAFASYSGLGLPPQSGFELLVNPGCLIPPEATEIHGITDAMVAQKPKFDTIAMDIWASLNGATALVGYNLLRFDLPIIWEEMRRCGITWDWTKVPIIDAGNLFKIKEPRTLEAAVQFYVGREHVGAHGAWADAVATMEVLTGQVNRYSDLTPATFEGLAKASRMEGDDRVDLAGKIVRNEHGVPCFAFGNSKGKPVISDLGFARWMLSKDFSDETKMHLRDIIGKAYA